MGLPVISLALYIERQHWANGASQLRSLYADCALDLSMVAR